jgi:hypothetical protein
VWGNLVNAKFQEIVDKLPGYMKKLNDSEFYDRGESQNFPDRGIYVFFENGKPLYVGRTDRMKERLMEHGRRSSGHNSATFAFILAKKDVENKSLKINLQQERGVLELDPAFKPVYDEMKDRVSKMQIKVVEVEDPVEQTFFEVYAALELETPHNVWENH